MQFNLQSTTITETNKRHGSADRIQRKLHSVERSNGGRLVPGNISIIRIEVFYFLCKLRYGTKKVRPHVGSGVNEQIKQKLNDDNLSSSKMKSCPLLGHVYTS